MYNAVNCLTNTHDWRLVLLAVLVCILTSAVAISLFHRAQVATGREQIVWLALDATAAGFGIWSTHFIAMLAFDSGLGSGFDAPLTIASLLIAILITAAGLAIALSPEVGKSAALAGGAIVGLGVSAMHYTGMAALEVPARLLWSPSLVAASILLGIIWASLALSMASKPDSKWSAVAASTLLTLAIVSMHFTAMGAANLVPDPTGVAGALSLSPPTLAFVVAGVSAIILSACLVAALGDQRTRYRVAQQKALLDTALASMGQGLCMFDADGRIMLFNRQYTELTSLPADSLAGHSLIDVIKTRGMSEDAAREFVEGVAAAMRDGTTDIRLVETKEKRMLRVVQTPRSEGGWVSTLEDITEWQKAQAKIEHMARHDALTNLPNRLLFRERLEAALRGVKRGGQVAVFCIDLDHFKEVNDTLGHPVGDELLREMTSRLVRSVREEDTVARLGGDEFAIIQAGSALKLADTVALATRVIEIASMPCTIGGHEVMVGASVGISVAPSDGTGPDQLLKNADMALYRAKSDGRGGYRFFEAGMDARALARRAMELDLRAALIQSEFDLEYQPLFDANTNNIICFEALLRWRHPQRGTIMPSDFIPLAEETGLIIPIGDWVISQACVDAVRWPANIHVAINVSPAQFKNRNLVSNVERALGSSGLEPNRLEIEITETVLLQGGDAMTTLHSLRALGVQISMDDFGTGYSSLSYLRSFPFDKIKIDRSFVSELATDGHSMAIVRAATGVGRSLGISTTAEGVETDEQLSLLRSELLSPAVPAAEVEKLLIKRLRVVA
jgi:diguanylate cyclase (GGDEF)-like protein/PAS domain S-box-containing protein